MSLLRGRLVACGFDVCPNVLILVDARRWVGAKLLLGAIFLVSVVLTVNGT